MKIFLSSRYSRRKELCEIRSKIVELGFEVVSRWLDTEWESSQGTASSSAPAEYREEFAIKDMEDVKKCNILIAFTEQPRSDGRGGRHVEFGAAVALNKLLIVVGPQENIFHHLPRVIRVPSTTELLELLGKGIRVSR